MQLLLNEKDICISAKNNLIYDDEKKLIDYMNDHFVWLSSTKWKSVDNLFLFIMEVEPSSNSVSILTTAMPKKATTKPLKRK